MSVSHGVGKEYIFFSSLSAFLTWQYGLAKNTALGIHTVLPASRYGFISWQPCNFLYIIWPVNISLLICKRQILITTFKTYGIADINRFYLLVQMAISHGFPNNVFSLGFLWGSYIIIALFEFSFNKISLIHSIGYMDTGGELESMESTISEEAEDAKDFCLPLSNCLTGFYSSTTKRDSTYWGSRPLVKSCLSSTKTWRYSDFMLSEQNKHYVCSRNLSSVIKSTIFKVWTPKTQISIRNPWGVCKKRTLSVYKGFKFNGPLCFSSTSWTLPQKVESETNKKSKKQNTTTKSKAEGSHTWECWMD